MSNPESESPETLEDPKTTTEDRPAQVVEMSGSNRTVDPSVIEQEEAETSSPAHASPEGSPRDSPSEQKPSRRLAIVLLALLLISVAFNVLQAQQQRRSAVQTGETELALDRAMERIDEETFRANSAEGTISEIDRNVDNVQERISDLQSALSKLSEATTR